MEKLRGSQRSFEVRDDERRRHMVRCVHVWDGLMVRLAPFCVRNPRWSPKSLCASNARRETRSIAGMEDAGSNSQCVLQQVPRNSGESIEMAAT